MSLSREAADSAATLSTMRSNATSTLSNMDLEARWSAEEQSQVLAHYGLESLFPDAWEDVRDGMQETADGSRATSKAASTTSVLGADPGGPAFKEMGTAPTGDAATTKKPKEEAYVNPLALQVDFSDPLGIKGSIWQQERRRSIRQGVLPMSFINAPPPAAILITSKEFDSKRFLLHVHANTSYRDLEQGAEKLATDVEARQETTRNLVRTQFSKFVNAKSRIDSFYSQMRESSLILSKNAGLGAFERSLEAVLPTVTDVLYTPMLARRAKAEKIRYTLAILEQWRFFFHLPTHMTELAKKAKYDAAVRDYKKGKHIIQSLLQQRGAGGGSSSSQFKSASLNNQRVFQQVWKVVQAIVTELQATLFHQLSLPAHTAETRERYIQFLIDLDAPDPLLYFLETRHTFIIEKFMAAHEEYVVKLRALDARVVRRDGGKAGTTGAPAAAESFESGGAAPPDPTRPVAAHASIYQPDMSTPEQLEKVLNAVTEDQLDVCVWQVTLTFVRTLCTILSDHFPEFHSLCKRVQRRALPAGEQELDRGAKRQGLVVEDKRLTDPMLQNILERFNHLLAAAVNLEWKHFGAVRSAGGPPPLTTDASSPQMGEVEGRRLPPPQERDEQEAEAAAPRAGRADNVTDESWVAAFIRPSLMGHSLVTTFFSTKLMNAAFTCFEQIKGIRIPSQGAETFGIFDALRRHLIHVVCEGLVTAAKSFYRYERWVVDVEGAARLDAKVQETPYLKTFSRFLKYHIRHLCVLSGARLSVPSSNGAAASATGRTSSTSAAPFGFGLVTTPSGVADGGASGRKTATAATLSMSKDLKEIRTAVFDALRAFLDGCEWLASQWLPAGKSEQSQTDHSFHAKLYGNTIQLGFGDQGTVSMSSRRKPLTFRPIDVHDVDKRLLLTLLHVDQLLEFVLPSIIELFETKFNTVCPTQAKEFRTSVLLLHNILFQNYLRHKTARLQEVVAQGILYSGLDWNRLSRPQEVRVSEFSRSLVRRVLCQLMFHLGHCLLSAYRHVDRFSPGGMLQAAMETEYIHHQLFAYETTETNAVFALVYDTIEQFVDEGALAQASANGEMNELLAMTKVNLSKAKATTVSLYLCFKEPGVMASTDELAAAP